MEWSRGSLRSWRLYASLGALSIMAAILVALNAHISDPSRAVAQCQDAQNKPLCYSDVIDRIMREDGISAAFDALAAAYDTDREFAGTCHAVTHEIGKNAYAAFKSTGDTELSNKSWYCGYGFYHGFMDALYVDTNDMQKARAFCRYVGEHVPHPPSPEFAEGSCYHGIGHGVTDGTDTRLWGDPMAIIKPGLALCEKVAAGNEEWHKRCASGVFNALGNMYVDPKYRLDPGVDPYALCRRGDFSPPDRESCYSQMNTQAAVLGRNDLPTIIAFTDDIDDARYRSIALRDAVSYYIQVLRNEKKSVSSTHASVCALSTDELTDSCLGGLVGGIIEFGSPGEEYKEALDLCGSDALPTDLRQPCFAQLQNTVRHYYSDDIVKVICEEVPREYRRSVCLL